jgi:hypothetical protein
VKKDKKMEIGEVQRRGALLPCHKETYKKRLCDGRKMEECKPAHSVDREDRSGPW